MLFRSNGALGLEEGGEEVPKDGVLTLDAWVLAVVKEEVGGGGNRARRAAAGAEEDEDDGDDSGLPGSIPWTRR